MHNVLLAAWMTMWSTYDDGFGVQDEARYILFDGDVDAVWVESMNSVMDDNKLLTLANGERIRLQPYARLLFEVSSLAWGTGQLFPHHVWPQASGRHSASLPPASRWRLEAAAVNGLLIDSVWMS